MPWLREHFQVLPPDADEVMIQQHARAYILMMIGASIFADNSGNEVQVLHLPLLKRFDVVAQFSWGSATLAYLYRQLCRGCQRGSTELGGFLPLLQIWSWEYIHIGRPIIVGYHGIDGQPLPDEPPRLLGPHHVRGEDPLGRRYVFNRLYLFECMLCVNTLIISILMILLHEWLDGYMMVYLACHPLLDLVCTGMHLIGCLRTRYGVGSITLTIICIENLLILYLYETDYMDAVYT
ncbi:unnamed protein product [Cuscuta epithymum]|uniref:Aminotransferase-like plant mobile domain-containing protein n=1 Tax=Cuscuta epithymum TaxID=186058 RepID=A0AAV0CP41_9ASTE|nr:unnamed protein product [Cuscuta epithymum]